MKAKERILKRLREELKHEENDKLRKQIIEEIDFINSCKN